MKGERADRGRPRGTTVTLYVILLITFPRPSMEIVVRSRKEEGNPATARTPVHNTITPPKMSNLSIVYNLTATVNALEVRTTRRFRLLLQENVGRHFLLSSRKGSSSARSATGDKERSIEAAFLRIIRLQPALIGQ